MRSSRFVYHLLVDPMPFFALAVKATFVLVGIGVLTACSTLDNHPLTHESSVVVAPNIPATVFSSLDPPTAFPRPAMKPPARGRYPPEIPAESANFNGFLQLSPESLLGYSGRDVALLLGDAVENVRSPPSQVMHYRFTDCRVTLYLYASLSNGVYRVLYSEIDSSGSMAPAESSSNCVISSAQLPARKTGNM